MYLRGFVGDIYTAEGWKRLAPEVLGKYATIFAWMHSAGFYGQTQYAAAAAALTGETGTEKIRIENLSACSAYPLIPYALARFDGHSDKSMIGDSFIRSGGFRGERVY